MVLKKIQFPLLAIFVVTTVVAVIFAVLPGWQIRSAVQGLSNQDLRIDDDPFGFGVFIVGEDVDKIRRFGKDANRYLVRALDDPERFAVAHWLLAEINKDRFDKARDYWNPAWVPSPDRSGGFDTRWATAIKEFWMKALAEPMAFDKKDQIMFQLMDSIPFKAGDLVPCEKEDEEFLLEIRVTLGPSQDEDDLASGHTYEKIYSICRVTEQMIAEGFEPDTSISFGINDLVGGSAFVDTRFVKYSPDSVTVNLDWSVEIQKSQRDFEGEFIAYLFDENGDEETRPSPGISGLDYTFRRKESQDENSSR